MNPGSGSAKFRESREFLTGVKWNRSEIDSPRYLYPLAISLAVFVFVLAVFGILVEFGPEWAWTFGFSVAAGASAAWPR